MDDKTITERDFRMPEFRDAKIEDYERRSDGKIVRKDRWECAIGTIRHLVGVSGRTFEIAEVVEAVQALVQAQQGWCACDLDELPAADTLTDIQLTDGSLLKSVTYNKGRSCWLSPKPWIGAIPADEVLAWREHLPEPDKTKALPK